MEKTYSTYPLRLRAVRAVLKGRSMADIADAHGTNRSTVFRWVRRYEEEGEGGLHRRLGSGRPRKLAEFTENELEQIVLESASSFGYETALWTAVRLQRVISDEFRMTISKNTVWRRLREAGLTCQKPEREGYHAGNSTRQEWLKKEAPKIRRAVKKYRGILYFQHEANVSLAAFLGKTWPPCGKTPTSKVTEKRASLIAMSAISRRGGLLFRLHKRRIASPQVIHFLGQLLEHHKRRHLIVVMDQAKPHISKKTKGFIESSHRLHVFYLPKYSPDWNPDEKIWKHLKH